MRTTRRQLLISGVRIGAGGCVYLVLGSCDSDGEARHIDIVAVLLEPDRVRGIGRVFARNFPEKVNTKVLERQVFEDLPTRYSVEVEVNLRLAQLIRQDFETERVFEFRRWMLSHTEGHLCALALDAPEVVAAGLSP